MTNDDIAQTNVTLLILTMSHRVHSFARHFAPVTLAVACRFQAPTQTLADVGSSRTVQTPFAANGSMMSPRLHIRVIRPNEDLEIAFDVRTRNAIYVLEKVCRSGESLGKGHRRPNFHEETMIPQEAYRSKLSHYKNSGFDRGHLAPAADFPLATKDTYTLCNVSPQNHGMNITIWCQIEDFVRKVADRRETDSDTYVVTGPLWLPVARVGDSKFQYSYLGLGQPPSLVSVPTHFFKVVVVVPKGAQSNATIQQFACFVVPNAEPDQTKTMSDYVVAWRDLEAVCGLQLFPRLVTDQWKDWADHLTRETVLRHTSSPVPQRLLQEGSSRPRGGNRRSIPKALQHLCRNGVCK